MSSTKIITANAIKNNYGTVAYGGNVGALMGSADFTDLAVPFKPNVVTTTITGAAPSGISTTIVSGGTFAGMVAGKYVGIGYDMTLANYVNPNDAIGAGDTTDRRSILALPSGIYTINYTDWSYMSGIASFTNSVTDMAYDHAAVPTRTIPGEFTYLETGSTPTNADYTAKTT